VRRPHAYFFLEEQFQQQALDTDSLTASPEGVVVVDGTTAPIPGVYILNQEGRIQAKTPLLDSQAKSKLLQLLMKRKPAKSDS